MAITELIKLLLWEGVLGSCYRLVSNRLCCAYLLVVHFPFFFVSIQSIQYV